MEYEQMSRDELIKELELRACFFEANPDPVIEIDIEGHIHYINQAGKQLLGEMDVVNYEHPWFAGLKSLIVFSEGDHRPIVREIKLRENYYRQTLYFSKSYNRIGIYGTDITGKKQAENKKQVNQASIAESFQIMSGVLEHTHMMAVLLDPQFNFIWVNRSYGETCGYDTSFFPGKNHFALYPNKENQDIFQHVVDGGEPFFIEAKPFEFPDQPQRGITYWDWSLIPIKDDSFKVTALVFTLTEVTERVKAEQALRESEENFRILFNQSGVGVAQVHSDTGRFVRANRKFCEIIGYSPEELKQTDFQTITYPEDLQNCLDKVELLNKGEIRNFTTEKRYIHKNGSIIWVNLTVSPMCKLSTETTGYRIAVIQDITARKEAEETLKQSHAELMCRTEALAHIGSWEWEIEEDKTVWSDELFRIFQINPDEGAPPFAEQDKLYHPEDLIKLKAFIETAINNNRPYELEIRIFRGDGEIRDCIARGYTKLDRSEKVIHLFGSLQDITELKKVQKALKQRLNELRCLYGISALLEQSHLSLDEILKEILLLIPPAWQFPEIAEASIILGDRTFKTDNFRKTEWIMSNKIIVNGKEAGIIEVSYPEIRNSFHKEVFLTDEHTLLRVIAERIGHIIERYQAIEIKKKLQEKLAQAQKMESISRIAGGVAHNFNNILAIILSTLDVITYDMSPENPIMEYLEKIHSSVIRASNLTRQLMSSASRQLIKPIVLDLNETLYGMLSMLKQITGENINIVWNPDDKKILVKMDPVQIDQILAPLLVNAREAIKEAGNVIIETESIVIDEDYCNLNKDFTPGKYVILIVSDNGCGMKEETLANIFEPFFTTKELYRGAGLGLSAVYGIVRQNNGFIKVYSEPDKGTTFKIYLPQYEEITTATQEKKPATVMCGKETVLIVDDELMLLGLMENILKRIGYTVLIATGPEEALNIAREHTGEIHMLITDVIMPDMNGNELVRKFLSLYPNLKYLFMSGYSEDIIDQDGITDKEDNFIRKPFSIKELCVRVREILDR